MKDEDTLKKIVYFLYIYIHDYKSIGNYTIMIGETSNKRKSIFI